MSFRRKEESVVLIEKIYCTTQNDNRKEETYIPYKVKKK